MSDQWYYSRDGQEHGPFPYTVLKEMAKRGELLATDQLWAGGTQERRLAADFPDLFVTVEPRSAFSDSSSLKGLTMALGIEPANPGHDPLLGTDVGGVRIVRLIAEGGMGRVYEGKQDKPSRTVAVKVMRPGLTSPSLLKRFEYEAEVLGRLQHPGIAHIYSVGVHRMGNASVPYFIMEYIADARTLTKYADDLKLPIRQRLDLFRSVCDAVAHGHQKGVIHRDLKPSNILVDAMGQPKVIDFGVARATDSDMALTTMQTDVGQLIGTLQYMSPEQFDANPNDIDVRSDVYALGVVLYQLLAGNLPYDVKKKAIHEVARIVREDGPTPLSSFNRALKGDVAVITGKCLEKERGRRYSSASELGVDIGRFLSGEAISASPPSFIDGVNRLARKHRAAATAVAGVFGALVIAVIGISMFAGRADEARHRAELAQGIAEKASTEAERRRAEAVAAECSARQEKEVASKRLYEANMYRLQQLIKENNRSVAQSLFQEVAAGMDGSSMPLELRHIESLIRGQAIIIREGHEHGVTAAVFSPDGTRLATGSREGTRLWDVTSGEQLAVLDRYGAQRGALAFSPDGKWLAAGPQNGTIRIWDVAGGKAGPDLKQHRSPIYAIAFSPDGTRLASIAHGRLMSTNEMDDVAVRIWDVASGDQVAVLEGHPRGARAIAFSPDGKVLATCGKDKIGRLWDVASGRQVAVLEGHSAHIEALAFSPDGKRVATGSTDHTARLWDVASGRQSALLKGHHNSSVSWLAFTPDGTRLATAWEGDETVRFWDVASGKQLTFLEERARLLAFSPDGSRLATATWDTAVVRLWDVATGKRLIELEGHSSAILALAFSPDGTRIATGSDDKTVRLWDVASGKQPAEIEVHGSDSGVLAFSPDSARLATADWNVARLWDVASGKPLAVLEGKCLGIKDLEFSPDGKCLAIGGFNNAQLWDVTHGKQMSVLEGFALRLAFSPDGRRLATAGSNDGTARLWDVVSGKQLAVLTGHLRAIWVIEFSPDGRRLATGSDDGTARLWDVASGEQLAVLGEEISRRYIQDNVHPMTAQTRALAFSPEGSRLAVGRGDGTVCMWDVATGAKPTVLEGHAYPGLPVIHSVAFSPDGKLLASGDFRDARLWDVTSGKQLAVLEGNARVLAFSPDGARLATGGYKTVRLWDSVMGGQLAVLEGHSKQIYALRFSPDGTRLATGGSEDKITRIWGASCAEMYRARQRTESIEHRLRARISEWLEDGAETAINKLEDAKSTLTPDEYRVAGNMILEENVRRNSRKP